MSYVETNRIKFIDDPKDQGAPKPEAKPKPIQKEQVSWAPSGKTRALIERFRSFAGEFRRFDLVENKKNRRPDIHAMLLLDEIHPKSGPVIEDNTHGEVYFAIDMDSLQRHITDAQIQDLVRCGVMANNVGIFFSVR